MGFEYVVDGDGGGERERVRKVMEVGTYVEVVRDDAEV